METHMLLPLPEPGFFCFDLFGEALPESLFLLLELGVLELPRFLFTELANFHLSLTVVLIMEVFSGRNEVQHVRPNKQGTEFPEVAMVLVFDCKRDELNSKIKESERTFSNTPEVFATLDDAPILGRHVFGGTNNGKRHGILQNTSMLRSSSFIISLDKGLIDTNALSLDNFPNLQSMVSVGVTR